MWFVYGCDEWNEADEFSKQKLFYSALDLHQCVWLEQLLLRLSARKSNHTWQFADDEKLLFFYG